MRRRIPYRSGAPLLAGLWLMALMGSRLTAKAVERFPPPEFEFHRLPVTAVPAPRAEWLEYLDVAVLAATLALGAWLVLRARSRRGILLLGIFSLLYFGFWRKGCICPVGATQNASLALFGTGYAVPLTVAALFLLPLATALLFGRIFCAAVCPLGMIQDVVVLRPVAVPRWLAQALSLTAVAYLAAAVLLSAVGAGFYICRGDPFVGFFRLSGPAHMIFAGALTLAVGMFLARPYCRFVCPYGVLLGWLSRFSWRHAAITPDECIRCRLCENACPFGAIRAPEDWSAVPRRAGLGSLAVAIAALPLLAAGGSWLGSRLADPLAGLHPTVQLADQVREASRNPDAANAATDAFRATGRPEAGLYREALLAHKRVASGAGLMGGFIGAVLGGRLLSASVRRRRTDYEADRATCLSCGRCFLSCPRERLRLNPGGKRSQP